MVTGIVLCLIVSLVIVMRCSWIQFRGVMNDGLAEMNVIEWVWEILYAVTDSCSQCRCVIVSFVAIHASELDNQGKFMSTEREIPEQSGNEG